MNEKILSMLLEAATLLSVPVLGGLGAYFAQRIKIASTKIKADKWEQVNAVIKLAVSSAQQQHKAGIIKDRKEYATELSKKLLKVKRIRLKEELLSPLIEAQVWDSLNAPVLSTSNLLEKFLVPSKTQVPPLEEKPKTGSLTEEVNSGEAKGSEGTL